MLALLWLPTCAKPGINERFLDPNLDVAEFVEIFESESREIYAHREDLANAIGLKPGWAVADVGAGTGPFLEPFARAVGSEGKVYAVDISPRFIDHLNELVRDRDLKQVQTVLCKEDSVELAPESIHAAFICDTYHHFEYPEATMASIHRALRPGGQEIVVDFHRIEGVSREWIFGHVRAGEEVFVAEIESCGFRLVESPDLEYLRENYFLRFEKI